MATHHPIRKLVAPEIPDKLYFRIGDVARLCEVPAYVLRFWETEFPQLKPNKGGTGQRLYRKRDVEMALRIKSLLYDQGYTIPGARQVFKSEARVRETGSTGTAAPELEAQGAPARELTGLANPLTTSLAASLSTSLAHPLASPATGPDSLAGAALAARPGAGLPPVASPGPGTVPLPATQRQRLDDLRAQMSALLVSLAAPVGAMPVAPPSAAPTRSPRLQMMRPRLVAMKAEAPAPRIDPRPSLFSLEREDQANLFPAPPASAE